MIRTMLSSVKNHCNKITGKVRGASTAQERVRTEAAWHLHSLTELTKNTSSLYVVDRIDEQCALFQNFDHIVPVLVQAEVRDLYVLPMIQFRSLYAVTQKKLCSTKDVHLNTYYPAFSQMMETFDSSTTYSEAFYKTVTPMLSSEELDVFTKLSTCPTYRNCLTTEFYRELRRDDPMLRALLEPEMIRLMAPIHQEHAPIL